MASNPMQKKSRNSFLLGMFLMLIIAAIAMVFLVLLMNKNNKKVQQQEAQMQDIYVIRNDIKSGAEITSNDLQIMKVDINTIPKNAYGPNDLKELTKSIKISETEYEDVAKYKAKINLTKGTVLNDNMIYEGETLTASERIQEYNMLQLPIQLDIGEFVDVRLQMSNGQDYIVVSHKEVKDITTDTIWLQLSEEEIILMSNAIVEAYISPASNLYVTKYVEPGMQTAAQVTYIPSGEVITLINQNANIVNEAKSKLVENYNRYSQLRGNIQTELDKYSDTALDNIQAQMVEAREKAKEAREQFLNGVN